MAEALVKYKFRVMIVSIDGATQETYSIYRRNGDLSKVLKNIEEINYYKKKYNSLFPDFFWKFIIFGHNEHEIPLVKELAAKYNMKIDFMINAYPEYSPIKNKDYVLKETGLKHLNAEPRQLLKDFNNKKAYWFFCNYLWEQPQINWDGRLLGCCALYKKDFGCNVFTDGYFEAMNNEKLIYAKNMVTNYAPHANGIPCSNCHIYDDLRKANYFVKSPRREF